MTFDDMIKGMRIFDEASWTYFCTRERPRRQRLFQFFFPHHLAEEMAQDFIIKIFEVFRKGRERPVNLQFCDNRKTFDLYLNAIARNMIRDQWKSINKVLLVSWERLTCPEADHRIDPDNLKKLHSASPEGYITLVRRINEVLDEYSPPAHAEIFRRWLFDGRSVDDLARDFKLTEVYVRVIIYRVKRYLAERL